MAEQVPEKNLNDPAVWKKEGDRFFEKGDYEAASMNYVRAIELNPDYLEVWNKLSLSLYKMGKMDEAGHAMHIVKDLQGEGPGGKAPPEPPVHEEPGQEKRLPDYARLERERKNPVIAMIASVFFAGLGQIYNGQNLKGFAILFGTIFGAALLIIPGLVIWLFGIYDAFITAKKMNYGKIPYKPVNILFVILYFLLLVTVMVVLAAAILAILDSLQGASPLTLINFTNITGDQNERSSIVWLSNNT
jgi:TM2 domain-containing membrane protein YozV